LSNKHVRVRENITIEINGASKSICALSAIDKSVTFMGKRNNLDVEKVTLRELNIMVKT
jgi:hypothetical protein